MELYRLFIVTSMLISINAVSQTTYFKRVTLFDDPISKAFYVKADSMNFYLSSKTPCSNGQDTIICMGISKHDEYSEPIWSRRFSWTDASNDKSIVLRNDSVFISGQIAPGESAQVYHLLVLNSLGDSLLRKSFYYKNNDLKGFYNNGLILKDMELFLFGQTSTVEENNGLAVVQSYDLARDTGVLWLFEPEFGKYFPGWDMSLTKQNNLVLLNEIYQVPPESSTIREILIISRSGKIIKRLYGPDYGSTSWVSNELVTLSDGSFLFLHSIDHFAGEDIPQLVKMDTSGQIIWTYDFPLYWYPDSIGMIGVGEILQGRNGDIIIAGARNRSDLLGSGNDIMLARMSIDGTMIWQRFYNSPTDIALNEFEFRYLSGVQELADESIVLVGAALSHEGIWIMKVDANGCLEGQVCGEDIVTSSPYHQERKSTQLSAFPTPTHGQCVVQLGDPTDGVCILLSSTGSRLNEFHFHDKEEIRVDLGDFPSDIYFLHIITAGEIRVAKIVKI